MFHDLQKASILKRISAYIFDAILLITVAVGIAFLMSTALDYDKHIDTREQLREEYQAEYDVNFDISAEDYEKLSDAEKKKIDDAYAKFATDPKVNRTDVLIINLTLIILVFSILIPFIIFEFLIPLAFGHGRTLGKKIFSIGVMRMDGVRISIFQLFVRTVLGKFTLETMLPIFLILLLLINVMPVMALGGLAIIGVLQLAFLAFSRHHAPIHDLISGTVAVDFTSQLIFDTAEELVEYKKKLHAEEAQKAEYR